MHSPLQSPVSFAFSSAMSRKISDFFGRILRRSPPPGDEQPTSSSVTPQQTGDEPALLTGVKKCVSDFLVLDNWRAGEGVGSYESIKTHAYAIATSIAENGFRRSRRSVSCRIDARIRCRPVVFAGASRAIPRRNGRSFQVPFWPSFRAGLINATPASVERSQQQLLGR